MAVGQIVIVIGAIKVSRHDTDVARAVLAVAAFAQLDASDLGDGVGFVGGFERAGEEVVFLNGLGALSRVDAARTQKTQILDAGLKGAVDDVVLDGEVFVDEVGAVGVVGINAADPGGGDEDVVGLFGLKEVEGGALVEEIEVFTGAGDQVAVAG